MEAIKQIFSIGVDNSFDKSQILLIKSLCNLSSTRSRLMKKSVNTTFELTSLKNQSYADIYLINQNQSETRYKELIKSAKILDIPTIIVGESSRDSVGNFTFIKKTKLSGLLLKNLDAIISNKPNEKKHCLVVDDSKLVCTKMKMIFDNINVKGSFVGDGADAIARTQAQNYDLIFLDVMLPGMDGYEVCKALKKNKRTINVPVIMLTSKGSPFNRIRGSMVGCDKYLVKPIDENKIEEVINDCFKNDKPTLH